MIKTILGNVLGAAMISAFSLALVSAPASAKGGHMGCDAAAVSKLGDGLDNMADGPGKAEANAEVAAVNTAMSNGDMRGCAVHLRKAEHLEMAKPSSM